MGSSFVLTTVILEVPPVAAAFGFTAVSPKEYLIAVGLAVLVIPIVEIVKANYRGEFPENNSVSGLFLRWQPIKPRIIRHAIEKLTEKSKIIP